MTSSVHQLRIQDARANRVSLFRLCCCFSVFLLEIVLDRGVIAESKIVAGVANSPLH